MAVDPVEEIDAGKKEVGAAVALLVKMGNELKTLSEAFGRTGNYGMRDEHMRNASEIDKVCRHLGNTVTSFDRAALAVENERKTR